MIWRSASATLRLCGEISLSQLSSKSSCGMFLQISSKKKEGKYENSAP